MLIKEADDKSAQIVMLEQLLARASNGQRKSIETELRNLRAGIKAEKDAAYLIDFSFRNARNWAVIHDLRIEVGGRVAQIDHLLISRLLVMFVLETKSFHAGLKITNDGEFLRWNNYRRTYEGMASPIAQNERHVSVLKDLFKQLPLPTRMGFRLEPTLVPLVLISPNSRIDRPRRFDTSCVIKADALDPAVNRTFDEQSALNAITTVAKMISPESLEELAKAIASEHKPASIDYAARFGLSPAESVAAADSPALETARRASRARARKAPWTARTPNRSSVPAASGEPEASTVSKSTAPTRTAARAPSKGSPRCRRCKSPDLTILYGRYGYYFKCTACSGNTPIKLSCGHELHRERLRKDGQRFYRECADCRTSTLFFENRPDADSARSTTRS